MVYVSANEKAVSLNLHRYSEVEVDDAAASKGLKQSSSMFRSFSRKRKTGGGGDGVGGDSVPGSPGSPGVASPGVASPGGAGAGVASGSGGGGGRAYKVFASMGRVRFARVEGTKPRLQPEAARGKSRGGEGSQALDPKTALARLRQLTSEQRVEAVRGVVRGVVSDLTDAEVDWSKTVFDNGMHSLNAVELLSRVNEALGRVGGTFFTLFYKSKHVQLTTPSVSM
jgi:hypothetical protein